MIIRRISSADPEFTAFREFTDQHPVAHFFQSPQFYTFIEGIPDYSPILFICQDPNGKIRGSLLAVFQTDSNPLIRFFSAGVIVRGGPLLDPSLKDQGSLLGLFLQAVVNSSKGNARFIQFRNFTDQFEHLEVYKKWGYLLKDHQNLVTPTTDDKKIWDQLKENRQRQIKKSILNGASIIEQPTSEEFNRFYRLLAALYRNKVHKPLPPKVFFDRYFTHVYKASQGIIHLVKYEDKIIGGIICPVSGKNFLHEWYICGMDHFYKDKGIYPSVLATWSAISFSARNGISYFDFMGLGKPEQEYGVRDFKLRFGGELVNFGRYERINNRFIYKTATMGLHLLKILSGFKKIRS